MRYIITLLIVSSVVVFQSCDDAGYTPSNVPRGTLSFMQKNLQHMDPNTDGVFELWLRLDSSGNVTNYSLGRFNINMNGEITSTAGGAMEFKYQGDTSILYQTTRAFVTVEPPGDNDPFPSNAVLISGATSFNFDSIYASLTIAGPGALENAGQVLISGAHTYYMLSTPTSTPADCRKGIWFCDINGVSFFPAGMQIPNSGWVYEAWVLDLTNQLFPIIYKMGRFSNPYAADSDGPGACAGPNPPYQAPGQDWIQIDCPPGKPQIQRLTGNNYGILITLEPAHEQPSSAAYDLPFFMTLYKQYIIEITTGCFYKAIVPSQATQLPSGRIRIAYKPLP